MALIGLAVIATVFAGIYLYFRLTIPRRLKRPESSEPSDDFVRIRGRMENMAAPTLVAAPAVVPDFSKLGGHPELPNGLDWPEGPEGPLAFLAQFDLQLARASGGPEWLPGLGAIYVFHDERWGMNDQVRIVHSTNEPDAPRTPPARLKPELRYLERRVEMIRLTSTPSLDWLNEDVRTIDVSESELDELANLPSADLGSGPTHKLGGYPDEIQEEQMALSCEHAVRGLEYRFGKPVSPEIEAASEEWRLLAQIDSDSKLKMNWGDGGMFYVFIREADARTGDFSRTVTLSQTH
ncbi:YwqG family protein [Phenylobacterium sp.]|uniref:YwqG family protein n=1 Tax=Phenylobacterium sp. TaxID=1871053 RepID=UPI002734C002|nr:YwqG family protein [Phenylobacterium sp.]MDP3853187.1 YwqG family protein [Phenylobacterium sp.]